MILYFTVFAGANASLSFTCDFMLPLLVKNKWTDKLARFSRPLSVGSLAVLILFITNGFTIDMTLGLYAFLLGGVSNIVGQWGANQLLTTNTHPLLQSSASNSLASVPSFNNSPPPVAQPISSPQLPVFGNPGKFFSGFGGIPPMMF